MAILFGFSARGILSEERSDYLLKIVERVRRKGIEPN